jgi:hypothetical protein
MNARRLQIFDRKQLMIESAMYETVNSIRLQIAERHVVGKEARA